MGLVKMTFTSIPVLKFMTYDFIKTICLWHARFTNIELNIDSQLIN